MTKPFEPIPPSQLFRTLLLHMIETHAILTPIVRTTLSRELKLCHMQNAYMLSEIESWLRELPEDSDLTPSLPTAQSAELATGLASCLKTIPVSQKPVGARFPPYVPPARTAPLPGTRQAASLRSAEAISAPYRRSIDGRITFQAQSSSAKPLSTSPITPAGFEGVEIE